MFPRTRNVPSPYISRTMYYKKIYINLPHPQLYNVGGWVWILLVTWYRPVSLKIVILARQLINLVLSHTQYVDPTVVLLFKKQKPLCTIFVTSLFFCGTWMKFGRLWTIIGFMSSVSSAAIALPLSPFDSSTDMNGLLGRTIQIASENGRKIDHGLVLVSK